MNIVTAALVALVVQFALVACGLMLLDTFASRTPQDLTELPRKVVSVRGREPVLAVASTKDSVGHGLSGQNGLGRFDGLVLHELDATRASRCLG